VKNESKTDTYYRPGPWEYHATGGTSGFYFTPFYPGHFTAAPPDNYTIARPCAGRRPHRCPVYNGHGTVSRPPWIAGDVDNWTHSDAGPYECRACKASGIVWEIEP
jgi:hypothetical protein